jgi:cobalt/nickel transport system permease protein
MAKIESAFFDIGFMDTLSAQETFIHGLDPRTKLVTTLIFIVAVVSFDRYEISAYIPFFIYPIFLITVGNLPVTFLLKKLLLVAPFAVLVGIFNPILDRDVLLQLGPLAISGGWVSFISILIRFVLSVGAALILIASTGFNAVCLALDKMGTPRIFTIQLMFMYRYVHVLVDEALRMARARTLRSINGEGMGVKVFGFLVGNLLLRTLDRAQRIHLAMFCRGFDGEIRLIRPLQIGKTDLIYLIGWSAFFVLLRFYNIPQFLGKLITELIL